ncbi:MAG: lipid-A-disaccharide synthase N-terminal domain-containing protein [Steroidobacteraceae bacterium]|nr:lipid-A-disaccharide synthase N-terminal domain-containing protein [Nevskiaceae bacterium]MCP5339001.1 lipid-A-disaccharide synthase N-terminal domain-containing protein [Nevskiaceae bacterium]MCP5359587.1 lipid-A-disaccharide synthase N-terminal domain-containing protein [Nevskiaceae bacterium]MCP5472620.1 lipid-A-disaccharide synthase N-terminal domain-containing protein [Nevskiaceae bacterium]
MGSTESTLWIGIGFIGQALFSTRFFLQWLASERAKRSIVPLAFWYFSLAGGLVLLSYAIHKRDPVFIVGQATGVFVYLRNLYLIRTGRRRAEA